MELVASSESVDVLVDLEAPQITFTNRTDGEVITADADNDLTNDQQVSIALEISEGTIVTERSMTLSIGGVEVIAQSADQETVTIANQTLVPGANVLTACVSDLANPESCTTITVNADPSEPGEPTNLLVTLLDPRAHTDTETGEPVGAAVDISFDAPGEDGAVGSVSGYEIRRVVKADPNALDVTQDEWDAAEATSYIYDESTGYDATTAPGDRVTIRIQGDGAYSRPSEHGLLQLGLTPNKIHTVAIKALDDAIDDTGEQIRNAPIADVEVDLTWSQQTFAFSNANGGCADQRRS